MEYYTRMIDHNDPKNKHIERDVFCAVNINGYEFLYKHNNTGLSLVADVNQSLKNEDFKHALMEAYRITDYLIALKYCEWTAHMAAWIGYDEEEFNSNLDLVKEAFEDGIFGISDFLAFFIVKPLEVMQIQKEVRKEKVKQEKKRIDGYVYILSSDSGYWKIGRTVNPADRIKTFSVKLPFRVEYEMVIPSTNHRQLEYDLHNKYDYCRVDGEWFSLTDDDIEELKSQFENVADKYNNPEQKQFRGRFRGAGR